MMSPKRTKFRKAHKGRIHGNAKGNTQLNFGAFGLKALEPERITARQIESARRAITRAMKRAGRVWIRIFPDRAGFDQARRSPYGLRQGQPGILGRPCAARPYRVRDRRRCRALAREALALGCRQAADPDQVRDPYRRGVR